ncbi:MAG: hypothetical protein IJM66_05830 [Muribaculaceae bacterium]|nr:hypothetical protein [Muribaculaceae bacterium]
MEQPTGVTTINVNDSDNNAPVFDLYGRQMQGTLPAGIYIKNGRKFIVR